MLYAKLSLTSSLKIPIGAIGSIGKDWRISSLSFFDYPLCLQEAIPLHSATLYKYTTSTPEIQCPSTKHSISWVYNYSAQSKIY